MTAPISREDWERQRREATDAMADVVAEVGLPKVLLPYQGQAVSLLDSTALCRVLFVEKSRRIGLTWGLAAYAVLRAGREKSAGGMDVMYISYSQEMTREFVDACAMWARAFTNPQWLDAEHTVVKATVDGNGIYIPADPSNANFASLDQASIAPYVAPAPTAADVNAERDSRLAAGVSVTVNGATIPVAADPNSLTLTTGLGAGANAQIAAGNGAATTVFRDAENVDHTLSWTDMQTLALGPPGYAGVPVTWANVARWWLRNPLHNLFWHALSVPFTSTPAFWPDGTGVAVAMNGLPLVAFRTASWEGYVGFRPVYLSGQWLGVFGLALRRSSGP